MDNKFFIRKLSNYSHLYSETLQLIEESFDYHFPHSFEIDFALLLNQENISNSYILIHRKTNEVIGHIGVMIRNIKMENQLFPFGLIGGIAIKKKYRGQGIFTNFFLKILNQYTSKVCLFLLWGHNMDFYKRFNFHLGMGMLETKPKKFSPTYFFIKENFQKTKLSSLPVTKLNSIKNIFETHLSRRYLTFVREQHHWNNILKISSTDLFIREEQNNNEIEAYFFVNKGKDLPNIIHEFGGKPHFINKLISILSNGNLWLPETEEDKLSNSYQKKYLVLMRMGNKTLFKNLISVWSENLVEIKEVNGENISFQFENSHYIESIENFFTFFFGPNPLNEFKIFSRPFFISGLDSI